MARGPKKVKYLPDQIAAKEESIKTLEKQLKAEKEELKTLKQTLSSQEVEKLQKFISLSKLTPEQAITILQEHSNTASEGAD